MSRRKLNHQNQLQWPEPIINESNIIVFISGKAGGVGGVAWPGGGVSDRLYDALALVWGDVAVDCGGEKENGAASRPSAQYPRKRVESNRVE